MDSPTDCQLPSRGWGQIDLAGFEPRAGREWTDYGTARRPVASKHRAASEMRIRFRAPRTCHLARFRYQRRGNYAALCPWMSYIWPGSVVMVTAKSSVLSFWVTMRIASIIGTV